MCIRVSIGIRATFIITLALRLRIPCSAWNCFGRARLPAPLQGNTSIVARYMRCRA